MRERPIIFAGESIRAILSGQKTQSRRVIKNVEGNSILWKDGQWLPLPTSERIRRNHWDGPGSLLDLCPYGIPGDRLWCKENIRRENLGWLTGAMYLADHTPVMEDGAFGCRKVKYVAWTWKRDVLSARFMPHWASRITLEIVNIRVERLQDISEEDACAEGVEPVMMDTGAYQPWGWPVEDVPYYYPSFAKTWDSINAKRGYGWDTNPWVFVIEFRRVDK